MARKCKEDAEKTRQAVLESALDVFSEKGYAKATFDEIAARAGFTKGAVYWYFRNKADLVAALIIEYVGRKREELMPNVPEGNTLENLLEYFVLWADAGEKDLRFSRFDTVFEVVSEWIPVVRPERRTDFCLKVLSPAKAVFGKYSIDDRFESSPACHTLTVELTGFIQSYIERYGI